MSVKFKGNERADGFHQKTSISSFGTMLTTALPVSSFVMTKCLVSDQLFGVQLVGLLIR